MLVSFIIWECVNSSSRLGMASLVESRLTKRDSEVIRVTEQQFEECKAANENGAAYVLEPKDGE